MEQDLPWDGTPPEDYLLRAINLGKHEHPTILKMKALFPEAWERAVKKHGSQPMTHQEKVAIAIGKEIE